MRAIFNTSVWLQAGQFLAPAAQIPAKQKSGCRPLRGGLEGPRSMHARLTEKRLYAGNTSGSVSRPQARTMSESPPQGAPWHFHPHQVRLGVPRCALDMPRCALEISKRALAGWGAP